MKHHSSSLFWAIYACCLLLLTHTSSTLATQEYLIELRNDHSQQSIRLGYATISKLENELQKTPHPFKPGIERSCNRYVIESQLNHLSFPESLSQNHGEFLYQQGLVSYIYNSVNTTTLDDSQTLAMTETYDHCLHQRTGDEPGDLISSLNFRFVRLTFSWNNSTDTFGISHSGNGLVYGHNHTREYEFQSGLLHSEPLNTSYDRLRGIILHPLLTLGLQENQRVIPINPRRPQISILQRTSFPAAGTHPSRGICQTANAHFIKGPLQVYKRKKAVITKNEQAYLLSRATITRANYVLKVWSIDLSEVESYPFAWEYQDKNLQHSLVFTVIENDDSDPEQVELPTSVTGLDSTEAHREAAKLNVPGKMTVLTAMTELTEGRFSLTESSEEKKTLKLLYQLSQLTLKKNRLARAALAALITGKKSKHQLMN